MGVMSLLPTSMLTGNGNSLLTSLSPTLISLSASCLLETAWGSTSGCFGRRGGLAEHRGAKPWRNAFWLYFTLLYFTYFTLLYWIEADTNPGLLSLTKKKWARIGPERWRVEAEAGFVAG